MFRLFGLLTPALLFAVVFLVSVFGGEKDDPIKILRIGDSITRYAASDGRLARALAEAGIRHEMVGSQDWPSHGRSNLMEGYNGVPIQFFTARQKQFGQPATLNTDAVPLDLALERFQPDLVLLMVGTNNLGSTDRPEINVPVLRGHLDKLLDRLHELAPTAHVIVATATPADNGYAQWPNMANRNERTSAYNELVVRPAVAARVAEGRSISLADAFSALDPATDLADGVHPNDSGKAKINATWFAAIQEWRAKTRD